VNSIIWILGPAPRGGPGLLPKYNILKVAGSLLGYKHTQESLIKISEANKGISRNKGINHSNYGKILLTKRELR
jgi:hypothetical protein